MHSVLLFITWESAAVEAQAHLQHHTGMDGNEAGYRNELYGFRLFIKAL